LKTFCKFIQGEGIILSNVLFSVELLEQHSCPYHGRYCISLIKKQKWYNHRLI